MCRDSFVKTSLTFFDQIILPIRNQMVGRYDSGTWRSHECYIGGYYWFSAVGGQEMSKYGPEWAALNQYIYKTFGFGAL